MNTLTSCALISTAIVSALAATPARAATANFPNTPNDGMVCRSGYTSAFNGTSLICSKTSEIKVDLTCPDPRFPNKIVRASAGGTPKGLDVCDKPGGVTITSTNDISNFVKGSDYEFAKPDDAQIATRAQNLQQSEATALGLTLADVEVETGTPVTDTTSGDSTDKSKVSVTYYTFAVRNGSIVAGPAGPSVSTNATSVFVPRALPVR